MAASRAAKKRPVRHREVPETQAKTLARLRRIEDLLAAGTSPDEIDDILVADEGLSHRQARRLRASLRERWREQLDEEGASRREQVYRQTQRFYQLCISGEKPNLPAAASALRILADLSGTAQDPEVRRERERKLAELGRAPEDGKGVLVRTRRALMLELDEVMLEPDPTVRRRWLAEITKTLGMTAIRTTNEEDLGKLEERVFGRIRVEVEEYGLEEVPAGIDWPATSAFAGRYLGGRGSGSGSDPPPEEDG